MSSPMLRLTAVGVLDVRVRVALDPQQTGLPQAALRVAGDGVLDLDDVGTPFAEYRTGRRNEAVHGDFEDADPSERPAHRDHLANVLDSRNSSSPAVPISLPMPDCLKPPNGLSGLK